jgi:hypothetical protein
VVYDTPDASFPLSHIFAYIAGWQFRTLKRSILSSSSRSATIGSLFSPSRFPSSHCSSTWTRLQPPGAGWAGRPMFRHTST